MKQIVSVISHNRPENIPVMQLKLAGFEVHWFVNKGDEEAYIKGGAANVHECGDLVDNRNSALDYSWDERQVCIQVDDDLVSVELARSKNPRYNSVLPFSEVIEVLKDGFNQTGRQFRLAGCAMTPNNFYFNSAKPISTRNLIVGNIMMIKDCGLYFDKQFKLKEDFDYTMQHIQKFGGVVRCNNLLATLKHKTNRGGCVDYRTEELEAEMTQKLIQKWHPFVKENPKRKNEVLIKVGR